MTMVLLGIGQLTKVGRFEDNEETDWLKAEIDNSDDVISQNSMFQKLVGNEEEIKSKSNMKPAYKRVQKDTSKGPSSRKL